MLSVFGAIIFAEKNELWNGFYEEMTPSQVMMRAKEILKPMDIDDSNNYTFKRNEYYFYNKDSDYDRPYTRCIKIKTKLEEYMQITSYNSEPSYQIGFYFFNDKLFHVQVLYNLYGNDIMKNLQKKYGEYKKKIKREHDFWGYSYDYEYIFKSLDSETLIRYYNAYESQLHEYAFVDYYNPKFKAEYDKQIEEKKNRKN